MAHYAPFNVRVSLDLPLSTLGVTGERYSLSVRNGSIIYEVSNYRKLVARTSFLIVAYVGPSKGVGVVRFGVGVGVLLFGVGVGVASLFGVGVGVVRFGVGVGVLLLGVMVGVVLLSVGVGVTFGVPDGQGTPEIQTFLPLTHEQIDLPHCGNRAALLLIFVFVIRATIKMSNMQKLTPIITAIFMG